MPNGDGPKLAAPAAAAASRTKKERTPAEAMAELGAMDDYDDAAGGSDEEDYPDSWRFMWQHVLEDATRIPAMRFTDEWPDRRRHSAYPRATLQVFSVEVAKLRRKKKKKTGWPLHVFGMVAVRDCVDWSRNILFRRARDDSQVLTRDAPCLRLTGPSRAVVFLDPAYLEVDLRVKGATEDEDERLSSLEARIWTYQPPRSILFRRDYASELSTLRVTLGHLHESVEATVAVRVVASGGTWLDDGRRVRIAAATASIPGEEIVLLDSGGDGGHHAPPAVADDGGVMLSRRVASVERSGELKVSVRLWKAGDDHRVVQQDEVVFKPKKAGRSYGALDVGFCQMEVTVAWSLISSSI